jgi:hypothetical protein
MTSYTAPPVRPPSRGVRRVELVFGGIEQAGPSFEGRVFLNHPGADAGTPRTAEAGYAGSFHVYGYGQPAPPAIAAAKAKQVEGVGAVAPIEKRVRADEAAVRAALERSEEIAVTVVAVPADPGGATPERPFERLDVLFDRAATAS